MSETTCMSRQKDENLDPQMIAMQLTHTGARYEQ